MLRWGFALRLTSDPLRVLTACLPWGQFGALNCEFVASRLS
jgi:hypothetical protein